MRYFLMVCHHAEGPEAAVKREAARPDHKAWVQSGGNGVARVLTGSAIWNDAEAACGNFGILAAASADDARAFAEGDPFYKAGIVTGYSLTRLADGFRAERIDPLTQG